MEREILFRGKRVDNGEWVTGGYFKASEEDGEIHYIFDRTHGAIPVIPETVCQFTGLPDKNGTRIFEGDILNWDHCGTTEYSEWMKNPVYKVIYKAGCFCAIGLYKELFCHAFRFKYCEITGNIHDK